MNDLTLIYLSANLIPKHTQTHVLYQLFPEPYPIISVTQKPVRVGRNICVGKIGSSPYNYYKQILLGAREARTEFVATCEDDTLYPMEHFTHRPPKGFDYTYNTNTWIGGAKTFWQSPNMNSFGFYISNRLALIKLLEERFKLFPKPPSLYDQRHFHEPGIFEYDEPAKVTTFKTKEPIIAFEHHGSLSGKRKRFGNPGVKELAPYGNAQKLYEEYWP